VPARAVAFFEQSLLAPGTRGGIDVHCESFPERALDLMGADPSITAARLVWAWIERGRRASFTVRDAFNALRSIFPHVTGLSAVLETLEERGYGGDRAARWWP